jgi:hypothetical protein
MRTAKGKQISAVVPCPGWLFNVDGPPPGGRWVIWSEAVAAYGLTFGSPAGSVFVGCEMAGGSEDGNESSSDLSSSLSISSWLLCGVPLSAVIPLQIVPTLVSRRAASVRCHCLTPLAVVAEVSLSRARSLQGVWSERCQKPTVELTEIQVSGCPGRPFDDRRIVVEVISRSIFGLADCHGGGQAHRCPVRYRTRDQRPHR